jgi:biotin synthase-like enzyme
LHAQFGGVAAIDPIEFVRTIAAARITMPKAMVRLSAGRRELGDAAQALCYFAGANSVFYGDKLLTTGNPDFDADRALFERLGINAGILAGPGSEMGTDLIADLGAGKGADSDSRGDVADVA